MRNTPSGASCSRLGFIGEEYKNERKILLKNLSGNGSFKSGARKGRQTMAFPSKEIVERVRREYPAGTRIRLEKNGRLPGTANRDGGRGGRVDDTASLMVRWSNGSHLHVIYGVDEVRKM